MFDEAFPIFVTRKFLRKRYLIFSRRLKYQNIFTAMIYWGALNHECIIRDRGNLAKLKNEYEKLKKEIL